MLDTRAIVFDLDGTLVDTMQIFADVAADTMAAAFGVPWAWARARYLETSGIPFYQQLEVIMPGDPCNAATAEHFEAQKLLATRDVIPSDATLAMLHRLRSAGTRIAISSNNHQSEVDRFIQRSAAPIELGLGFADGCGKGPRHFERVRAAFGCTEMLFVGDSIHDARLARQLGIPFVAILGTASPDAFAAVAPNAPQLASVALLAA